MITFLINCIVIIINLYVALFSLFHYSCSNQKLLYIAIVSGIDKYRGSLNDIVNMKCSYLFNILKGIFQNPVTIMCHYIDF